MSITSQAVHFLFLIPRRPKKIAGTQVHVYSSTYMCNHVNLSSTFTPTSTKCQPMTLVFQLWSHTPKCQISPRELMTGHFSSPCFCWGFWSVRWKNHLMQEGYFLLHFLRSQETALDFASRSSCKSLAYSGAGPRKSHPRMWECENTWWSERVGIPIQ